MNKYDLVQCIAAGLRGIPKEKVYAFVTNTDLPLTVVCGITVLYVGEDISVYACPLTPVFAEFDVLNAIYAENFRKVFTAFKEEIK